MSGSAKHSQLPLPLVTQVETIGDAYMVAAGLLDTSENHAEGVANMAFGMRDAAKYVAKPATEEFLQVGNMWYDGHCLLVGCR